MEASLSSVTSSHSRFGNCSRILSRTSVVRSQTLADAPLASATQKKTGTPILNTACR